MRWIAICLWCLCLVASLVLSVCSAGGFDNPEPTGQPTPAIARVLTVNSLPGSEIDCVLVRSTNDRRGMELVSRITRETGLRAVSYPDGYIPVLVPADKVRKVRDLLGSGMCPLTEGLADAK